MGEDAGKIARSGDGRVKWYNGGFRAYFHRWRDQMRETIEIHRQDKVSVSGHGWQE